MKPDDLTEDVRKSREAMRLDIKKRFIENVEPEHMEFWSIATYLDPRWKDFDFDGNNNITDTMKKNAISDTETIYNLNYRGRFFDPATVENVDSDTSGSSSKIGKPSNRQANRVKISSRDFFSERGSCSTKKKSSTH